MPNLRLTVNRLRDGMVILEDVHSHSGTCLYPAGTVVDADVIARLTRHFIENVIVEYGRAEEKTAEAGAESLSVKKAELSATAQDILTRCPDADGAALIDGVNRVLSQVEDPDLQKLLQQMKAEFPLLYRHSVSVGALARLLAEWDGRRSGEVDAITLAGLVHDIGFLDLWKGQSGKKDYGTECETERAEKHVVSGFNLLKRMNVDNEVRQALLTHHERADGSGFPLKVHGNDIPLFSRLVAVADTYEALAAKGSVVSAIREMERQGYNRLDSNFLKIFLKHAAQTLLERRVLLNDGREGIVTMINDYRFSSPLIRVGDQDVDLARTEAYYIKELAPETEEA